MSPNIFELHGLEILPLIGEGHWNYRASRVLHVACQFELFTHLVDREATHKEIADVLGTDPTMTEKLLIALCALGLLEKTQNKYRNTLLAETYLVKGMPLYQGDIIRHSAEVWDVWNRLEAIVYTGKRDAQPSELPSRDEDHWHRNFILGMHNISITGQVQTVVNAVDFGDVDTFIDVGGGPGTYCIGFCQRYPGLRATLFDLPETLAYARQMIADFEMQDRIELKPGNWNEDEFGEDFGALLMSNVLHGPGSNAGMKLRKAHRALHPGGILLAQDFLMNDEKTGPLLPALFNIMVGAYSISELRAEIERAGFMDITIAAVGERGNTLITARKPES